MIWKRFGRLTFICLFVLAPGFVFGQSLVTQIDRKQERNGSIRLPKAAADEVEQEKTSAEIAEQFEKVWNLVKERFYTANLNGVDWKKIGEKYRAHLSEVKTAEELEEWINKMLSELHASHTAYITNEDVE